MAENVQYVPFSLEEKDKEEAQKFINKHAVENIVSHMQKKQTEIKDVKVNFAVAGAAGSGKSTYINTVRGIRAWNKGAAAVGCTETTKQPTPYAFPTNANVKIWDLPGLGTTSFTKENYAEKVKLDRYDFFLIFTQTRFTDNDLWLAGWLKRKGKGFYLVRTRIDEEVVNNKRDYPKEFNERKLLAKITEEIKKSLEKKEMEPPKTVYLISTILTDTGRFDFQKLQHDMTDALDDTQRQVLSLALCNLTEDLIKQKCDDMRSRIWRVACACGAAGAIPITVVDKLISQGIVVKTVTDYQIALGLDAASIQRLSDQYGVSRKTLEAAANHYLKIEISSAASAFIKYYAADAVRGALSIGSRWIPYLGPAIGVGLSFGTTYTLLHKILSDMEKAAIHVIITALKPNTT